MKPLFRTFEFKYLEGFRFWDRSGEVSCKLIERIPSLVWNPKQEPDQRDFTIPTESTNLFFGIQVSQITSLIKANTAFFENAETFYNTVTSELEITQLYGFNYSYIFGKPCGSRERAEELFWPLFIFSEAEKMKNSEGFTPKGAQVEFAQGGLDFSARIAIADLDVDGGGNVPHLTIRVDILGTAPISVDEFEPLTFMRHVEEKHVDEILEKLAPHLKD